MHKDFHLEYFIKKNFVVNKNFGVLRTLQLEMYFITLFTWTIVNVTVKNDRMVYNCVLYLNDIFNNLRKSFTILEDDV